jgi:hypothetical protein
MQYESIQSELARLRRDQRESLESEVFLGLTPAERAEYDRKTDRIHALEIDLALSGITERSLQSAKTRQRQEWNKDSETDTPQNEAHQPYRSREKDSPEADAESLRSARDKRKNERKEEGTE